MEWNEFFGEKFSLLVSGHVVPKIRFFKFTKNLPLEFFWIFTRNYFVLKAWNWMKVFFWGETLVFGFSCQNGPKCGFQVQWKFEVWFFFIWALGIIRVKMSYKMNLQNEFCKFHNEFKHGMFLVFCMK